MPENTVPPSTPTPTLTPLHREPGFLAAVVVGLPALIVAYALGWNLMVDALDEVLILRDAAGTIGALVALLAANPITVYLAARQYPRGKSVEAIGQTDMLVQADALGWQHVDTGRGA